MKEIIGYILFGTILCTFLIGLCKALYDYYKRVVEHYENDKLNHYNHIYESMYRKYDYQNKKINLHEILGKKNNKKFDSNDMIEILKYLYKTYDPDYRDEVIDDLLNE